MAENQWHLDKRVPLAMIIAIASQSALIVWWAAGVQAQIDSHDRAIEALSDTDERLARIEVILERLERRLDRESGQ